MKSQVNVLLHTMRGLCKDVLAAYPALKGIDLDYKRIALYCRYRGLSFFTLDLPNLDSMLLHGLEIGRLELSGPLVRVVSRRTRVPRLFSGLWLRVFDRNACLKQDADPNAILFLRQLSVIGKRLEVECTEARRQDAIRRFHDVEQSLPAPSLRWCEDKLDVDRLDSLCLSDIVYSSRDDDLFCHDENRTDQDRKSFDRHLLRRCQQVADLLSGSFPFFEPVRYSMDREREGEGIGFKHGPGAVAEQLKNWEKSQFPYWPHKLEEWFPYDVCASMPNDTRDRPLNHEVASRLHCVPKTAKGPRLIAAEPISHQWCQQIVWAWLRDQLKQTLWGKFVDFRRQDLSGDMVLQASLDRKLATVDLSDASDRLTCWTVERIFRRSPSLLSCLHAARTRYVRDDISYHKGFLNLKKFASQGTATTFPVQSIVFLIIAVASCISEGEVTLPRVARLVGRVRVFGDDIIIPTHGYARLCRIMSLLSLKVNEAKSFSRGQFRESCGTDGYMGYDVTPVKPRYIVACGPEQTQGLLDSVGNLFKKGFWHASQALSETIDPRIIRGNRIVRVGHAGYPGLPSFVGSLDLHLSTRWNKDLQRYECKSWSVRHKTSKEPRNGYAPLIDFLSRAHSPDSSRDVSSYGRSREVRSNLRWEPLNTDSFGAHLLPVYVNHSPVGVLPLGDLLT